MTALLIKTANAEPCRINDQIRAALTERGYTLYDWSDTWRAFKSAPGEIPECEDNKRPPQLGVRPWTSDPDYPKYEVFLAGCTCGQWYELRAYCVLESELLEQLSEIEARLVRGWSNLSSHPG